MNYLVTYSCYETAEYYTKQGAKFVSNNEIWHMARLSDIDLPNVLPNF
jgi:hypothetical protein